MTEEERDSFLAALIKLGYVRPHRIYVVMFWSALRRGEVGAMKLRWIDWKNEFIRIPATDSKSGAVEEIDLHPKVAAALKEELAERGSLKQDEPIFGTFDCKKAFRKAITEAKVDPYGLTAHHSARHTCATLAAESTNDVMTIQAVGRWKSLQMAQRYTHPDGKRSRAALRRI